jgi:hypothetical protein
MFFGNFFLVRKQRVDMPSPGTTLPLAESQKVSICHDLSGAAQDLEKNTRATPAGQSHSNNKNYVTAGNILWMVTFFMQ